MSSRAWVANNPISIHAPQWGATSGRSSCAIQNAISIHAPQWGATGGKKLMIDDWIFQSTHPSGVRPHHLFRFQESLLFQSTHPSGVRRDVSYRAAARDIISIHAPQWGATGRTILVVSAVIHFNPRTPVGCDLATRGIKSVSRFQSTHPSGVRLVCVADFTHDIPFQSTHPSGVRQSSQSDEDRSTNFNPRTPVGCDCENGHSIP